jgi:RNA polymerase sigma factor (sigma-70 family)
MARFTDISIDDATVAAAGRGDGAALEQVYGACAVAVHTLIRRLVRREAVAEELTQETFVDVIEHIGSFHGRAPLPMWIRSIAVRRSLMYLRSPWHRSLEWLELRPDADPRQDAETSRQDARRDLEAALRDLPALTRAVVWLHDVEGYTHGEIAAGLGRTTSFSKSQLSRAHARLRHVLEPSACECIEEDAACTPISTS